MERSQAFVSPGAVCDASVTSTVVYGSASTCSSGRSLEFWDYAVLGAYSALAGWIILKHEAWADEAQAWLIARDSGLVELFTKRLHYEGAPGLWHFLLWLMARLDVTYAGMHWITGLFGVSAVYVLLRYSPFPPLIRRLIPFGFALVIQTAVVPRSYSLLPLLLFTLCVVTTSSRHRPMAFAVVAGLLANLSAHCVFLAMAMVPVYLSRLGLRQGGVRSASVALPGIVLTGFLLCACYTGLPAADASYGLGHRLNSHPSISKVLGKITGTSPQWAPHPDDLSSQTSSVRDSQTWDGVLVERILTFLFWASSYAFFVVSSSNILAGVFYGALVVWLSRHKVLITALPLVVVLCVVRLLSMTEHHTSILWCALLATLWLAWGPASTTVVVRVDVMFRLVLIAVLIEQAGWMAHDAYCDIRGPFDGGLAAYQFLESQSGKTDTAIVNGGAVSMQPYSRTNLFFNQSTSYNPNKENHDPEDHLDQLITQHPAFIVDSEFGSGDVIWGFQFRPFLPNWYKTGNGSYLKAHNYRETHRFCGFQPHHFGIANVICQVIYEPTSAVVASDAAHK